MLLDDVACCLCLFELPLAPCSFLLVIHFAYATVSSEIFLVSSGTSIGLPAVVGDSSKTLVRWYEVEEVRRTAEMDSGDDGC